MPAFVCCKHAFERAVVNCYSVFHCYLDTRTHSYLYARKISERLFYCSITLLLFLLASDKQHIFRRTSAIVRLKAIFLLKFFLLNFILDITSSKTHAHTRSQKIFIPSERVCVLCVYITHIRAQFTLIFELYYLQHPSPRRDSVGEVYLVKSYRENI